MAMASASAAIATDGARSAAIAICERTGDLYICDKGLLVAGDIRRPVLLASASSNSWRIFVSLAYLSQSLREKRTKTRSISRKDTIACAQYTGTKPQCKYSTRNATEPMFKGSSTPIESTVDKIVRPWLVKTPPVLHSTISPQKVFSNTGGSSWAASATTSGSLVITDTASWLKGNNIAEMRATEPRLKEKIMSAARLAKAP
mmetsp:Transcript_90844/g.261760  ORF Transcript_90844/g.261760 Transcript_90844/m.261760 type:complete len:202 (-) Transcript_90844:1100-1705(-)